MNKLEYLDVLKQLTVLDIICAQEDTELELALFGGTALLLHLRDEQFRSTMDIDYRFEGLATEEQLRVVMEKAPNVFQRLSAFPEYPDSELYREYSSTYVELEGVEFQKLRIVLPTIEMIALSKLVSNRQKDLDDLLYTPVMDHCDLNFLHEQVQEAKEFFFNTREFNFWDWDDILKSRKIDGPNL